MRAVVQRVKDASVSVNGSTIAECKEGILTLLGVHREDTPNDAKRMADRIFGMRIFNDQEGKLNLSLTQAKELFGTNEIEKSSYGILAVSNFTLLGDTSKGRRPTFMDAAGFEQGKVLFDLVLSELRRLGAHVETGIYGADMQVNAINDGPVTLVVDTR